ncbi:MAG: hypothetical protein IVW57_07980 [Ktedonobacterales bacterium]|nr:hypothetical protein [Ktedonobacterales bacterium]
MHKVTPDSASAASAQPSPLGALDNLFSIARPSAVYSEAVTAHDQTVITASEVSVSMGFGFGSGGDRRADVDQQGSGGGGGGRSNARPVAVISIGPGGVRIEPIIDVGRIVLTGLATFGALLLVRAARRPRR